MQDRLLIAPQIMMRLRGWLPFRFVDELFDARNFPIVCVSKENYLVLRIGREHLSHGTKLGWKIRVS